MNHRLHVCPMDSWNKGIAHIITTLVSNGMTRESKVLDVGCGCLRLGKPLIELLDRNCYAGVEPCASVLHDGITEELGEAELLRKNPVFLYSPEFDFTPLRGPFTHVLANDLFIHCGERQFRLFLERVSGVVDRNSKIIVTANIGRNDKDIDKASHLNTPEEKGTTNRFLYAHADNNTTIYSMERFSRAVSDHGFVLKSLSEFPREAYTKHTFLIQYE